MNNKNNFDNWVNNVGKEFTNLNSRINLVDASRLCEFRNNKYADFIAITCDHVLCDEIPFQTDQEQLLSDVLKAIQSAISTIDELCDRLNSNSINQRVDLGLSVEWDNCNCNTSSCFSSGCKYPFDSAATLLQNTLLRLPTIEEAKELIDNTYFTFVRDFQGIKEHDGAVLVSKINHKALFIPAMDHYGYGYWGRGDTSTCCELWIDNGYEMCFDHNRMFNPFYPRVRSEDFIRPVYK